MAKTDKCAHPACSCTVKDGEKYCSGYCHDAGNLADLACGCGHLECTG